jgi:hypothetical protein
LRCKEIEREQDYKFDKPQVWCAKQTAEKGKTLAPIHMVFFLPAEFRAFSDEDCENSGEEEIEEAVAQLTLQSTRKSAKRPRGRGNSSSSAGLDETTNFTCDVAVLPIFGIGGMGKTTLAQLIYNDQRVKAHYSIRIWVCVSDLFDIKRMTKEIVKTVSGPKFDLSSGLTDLRAELKEQLKSQMFLLVLDDICQITQQQWESFYAYLRDGVEGSMILVTTNHENIAHLVKTSTCKPVQLKGLSADTFWDFFKKCAFGKESPESYPLLQEIGWRISSKLYGTPLAKTLGRL